MQFSELPTLFYDFQGARLVHFLGMAAIVCFSLVHVALALLVPKTLVAMVTGGPSSTPLRGLCRRRRLLRPTSPDDRRAS